MVTTRPGIMVARATACATDRSATTAITDTGVSATTVSAITVSAITVAITTVSVIIAPVTGCTPITAACGLPTIGTTARGTGAPPTAMGRPGMAGRAGDSLPGMAGGVPG